MWMAALLIVWRLLQDYVNSPRIMGKNLELPPLIVVFALMVGGQVGGIAGIYLAVPAIAVLPMVWLECFPAQNSQTPVSDQPIMKMKAECDVPSNRM
jgi:predicted PurR-regulated permease PerM